MNYYDFSVDKILAFWNGMFCVIISKMCICHSRESKSMFTDNLKVKPTSCFVIIKGKNIQTISVIFFIKDFVIQTTDRSQDCSILTGYV